MQDTKRDRLSAKDSKNPTSLNGKPAGTPGLKKNISYSFLGNLIYTICQWGVLVVLTKLTDVEVVGHFAFAAAICTPVTVLASMNLQTVQVTDSKNANTFRQFLGLRLITVFAAMLMITAIALVGNFSIGLALIIIAVGFNQCFAITREVFRSYLQKQERMGKVAISQITAGIATLAAFTAALFLTQSLLIGIITMGVARLLSFLAWDLPAVKYQAISDPSMPAHGAIMPQFDLLILLRLAWLALPIALMAVLTRTVGFVPRYFIEFHFGAEQLGYFAALAAIPLSSNLALQATTASSLPRLSRQFAARNRNFFKLWAKVTGINIAFGIAGIAVAYFAGKWLLTVMFTADYAVYHKEFVLLMVYGLAAFVAGSANGGLNSTRRFWFQPPLFSAIAITVLLACWWLVPAFGIEGATWAMIAGRSIQTPIVLLMVLWLFYRTPAKQDSTGARDQPQYK